MERVDESAMIARTWELGDLFRLEWEIRNSIANRQCVHSIVKSNIRCTLERGHGNKHRATVESTGVNLNVAIFTTVEWDAE